MGYIIICFRLGGKFISADFCVFEETGTVLVEMLTQPVWEQMGR